MKSFGERLGRVGLLDRYALAGAVAGWWYDAKYDLLALSENGFAGVVDGWVENVDTLLSPEQDARTKKLRTRTAAERRQAYDHKVVAAIAPRLPGGAGGGGRAQGGGGRTVQGAECAAFRGWGGARG